MTQYLHIINLSLTFPAIKNLRTQGKRMKGREKKKKREFEFLCYLLGQQGGNLWEKNPKLAAGWTVTTVMLNMSSNSRQRSQNCATDLYNGAWGEPSWQGSNAARPWIRPASSAGQFLCLSSHSSLFMKLAVWEYIWLLSYQYLLCCPIHWIIRINKLPHDHPQLQL